MRAEGLKVWAYPLRLQALLAVLCVSSKLLDGFTRSRQASRVTPEVRGQPHGVSDSRFSRLVALIGYCEWTWHELRAAGLYIRVVLQAPPITGSGQTGFWLGTEPSSPLGPGRCVSSNQYPLKGPMPRDAGKATPLKAHLRGHHKKKEVR